MISSTLMKWTPKWMKTKVLGSTLEHVLAPIYFLTTNFDSYEFRTPQGVVQLELPEGVGFTKIAEQGELYESALVDAMSKSGLSGEAFYDVGARYGFSSRAATLCGVSEANIYAFELSDIYFRILQRNLPKAHLEKCRVGDGNSGTIGLAKYAKQARTAPSAIKVDVEGAEGAVLNGLWPLLKNEKPTLFIELHPYWIGPQMADDLVKRITNIGYEVLLSDHHSGENDWRRYTEPMEEEFLIWCR